MDVQKDIAQVKGLVEQAKSVLVVTHENPTADSVGSALAAYLGLIGMGKMVTVACPSPMTVALSGFVGVNKFASELGKRNFVISLDYVDGSIEKVSYNIEGDKFHLVIEPRPGHEFTQEKAHFSHQGTIADVIVAIDTIHLGGLAHVYETEKELFAGKSIINIDRHGNNSRYGTVNIIDPSASSTAELVAQILSGVGVKLTVDIANNLLNAMYAATDNFTAPNLSAAAFDVAAVCVRAGAKKFAPAAATSLTPASITTATLPAPMAPPPIVQKAPEDWLKPKIFKSTSVS